MEVKAVDECVDEGVSTDSPDKQLWEVEKQELLKTLYPFVWAYETARAKDKNWIDALDYLTLPDLTNAVKIYRRYIPKEEK